MEQQKAAATAAVLLTMMMMMPQSRLEFSQAGNDVIVPGLMKGACADSDYCYVY